jgi:3-hydroxyisobutyrate dehydrogenase-like beta-hydroxyacid dehydrogenase
MDMGDVTVIGLGAMGTALARAFLSAGKTTVVWNRTSAKADVLRDEGAKVALTAAEAVVASPVIVMCLSDYAATRGILEDKALAGIVAARLVVQLASGTSREARAMAAWAAQRGADYLDGAISAWPSQIGGADAAILLVGPETTFASASALLQALAGSLVHVGPDVGHAKALFGAALAYYAAHWIGFSHGAVICEAEGLDPAQFGEMMAGSAPFFADDMRRMGRVIATNSFSEPESTIASVRADIARLVDVSDDLEIGADFPTFATGVFQRAVDAGYGAEEHCAITKVLRSPSPHQRRPVQGRSV